MSDVDPAQTTTLLSLCTGYGGLEMAVERVIGGVQPVAFVEVELYAVELLVGKMAEGTIAPAPIWTDLKTFPAEVFAGKVGILTAGYPCQPFSIAGRRLAENDPRHLWPDVLRCITAAKPAVVFIENVEGHINKGLQSVLVQLEEAGYRATWGIFSAEEMGAPHVRRRIFILAVACDFEGWLPEEPRREYLSDTPGFSSDTVGFAHCINRRTHSKRRQHEAETGHSSQTVVNPDNSRLEERGREKPTEKEVSVSEHPGWPARPGEQQYEYEPSRLTEKGLLAPDWTETLMGLPVGFTQIPNIKKKSANRIDRLRLLGNGVVPQTAKLAFKTLGSELGIFSKGKEQWHD